jgi:uncharacterized DUF497 family protein
MLLVYQDFEWDLREAAASVASHGVSFREAATVFADDNVAISEDPAPGHLRALGLSSRGRMLAVVHKRGHRIRILGATLHPTHPAEVAPPELIAAPPVAAEPLAAGTEAAAETASLEGRSPGSGWTAETYGIYWDAYSAARQAARQQGKSAREAQRLGRQAGERAMAGRTEPSPRPSTRSST